MTRIDTHHHVWDLAVREQDWMTGPQMDPVRRNFGLDDLAPLAARSGIDRTVLVQTVAAAAETGEFLDLASDSDLVAGVVGWVDLESADVADALARQMDHPGVDKLVGIRDLAQYKDDPEWLARPGIIRAVTEVGRRGLTYDVLVVPEQLPAAVTMVRSCPDQPFVLNHIAKPHIAQGEIDRWAADITALAACPNVACKVSGMVTEAAWHAWTVDDFRPYVDHLLDTFGPSRLMFGSDWPVCLLSADYDDVVGLAAQLVSALSEAEAEQFWSGTATRFYRLDEV